MADVINPPPELTESLTALDRELIPQIIGDFAQLSETAREVVLNLALPQYLEE